MSVGFNRQYGVDLELDNIMVECAKFVARQNTPSQEHVEESHHDSEVAVAKELSGIMRKTSKAAENGSHDSVRRAYDKMQELFQDVFRTRHGLDFSMVTAERNRAEQLEDQLREYKAEHQRRVQQYETYKKETAATQQRQASQIADMKADFRKQAKEWRTSALFDFQRRVHDLETTFSEKIQAMRERFQRTLSAEWQRLRTAKDEQSALTRKCQDLTSRLESLAGECNLTKVDLDRLTKEKADLDGSLQFLGEKMLDNAARSRIRQEELYGDLAKQKAGFEDEIHQLVSEIDHLRAENNALIRSEANLRDSIAAKDLQLQATRYCHQDARQKLERANEDLRQARQDFEAHERSYKDQSEKREMQSELKRKELQSSLSSLSHQVRDKGRVIEELQSSVHYEQTAHAGTRARCEIKDLSKNYLKRRFEEVEAARSTTHAQLVDAEAALRGSQQLARKKQVECAQYKRQCQDHAVAHRETVNALEIADARLAREQKSHATTRNAWQAETHAGFRLRESIEALERKLAASTNDFQNAVSTRETAQAAAASEASAHESTKAHLGKLQGEFVKINDDLKSTVLLRDQVQAKATSEASAHMLTKKRVAQLEGELAKADSDLKNASLAGRRAQDAGMAEASAHGVTRKHLKLVENRLADTDERLQDALCVSEWAQAATNSESLAHGKTKTELRLLQDQLDAMSAKIAASDKCNASQNAQLKKTEQSLEQTRSWLMFEQNRHMNTSQQLSQVQTVCTSKVRALEAQIDAEKEAHRETSFSLITAKNEISSLHKSQADQVEELSRVHQQIAGYKVALGVRDNEIAAEQHRLQTVRRVRDLAMQRTKAMAAQHAHQTSSLEDRLKDGESDKMQLASTVEELNRKLDVMSATVLGERLDHREERTRLEDQLSAERNEKQDYAQTVRELQTARKEEQLLASKRQRMLQWELGSMRNFMQLSGR